MKAQRGHAKNSGSVAPRNFGKIGPSGSMKAGGGREGLRVQFTRGIHGSDPILGMPYPQIAFVGRSNVGKSSIINALLGGVFARVSATPGKTQEINFYTVDDRLFVVDLPGYGYAKLPIPIAEKIRKHILWYLGGGEVRPKIVLLILDARVGVTDQDRELIDVVRNEGHPLLVVLNKWDKLNQSEAVHALRDFKNAYPDIEVIPASAEKKYNIPLLFDRLALKK